jgi:nucleotidyltransferase substrate binding protein (TIGR01987 family)
MNKTNLLLQDFEKAVKHLENALQEKNVDDLIRAGCIQYFEFCFELSWKTIKSFVLREGLPDCYSPKSCLQIAFKNNWIDEEEIWIRMLNDRNLMTHTYDSDEALEVYKNLSDYLEQFRLLLNRIKPLLEE